jgi:transposase
MSYYISKKKVRGRTYYYAQRNVWTSKGSRVAEQIYLGSAEMIVNKFKDESHQISLKTYRFGRIAALLAAAEALHLREIVNTGIVKTKGYRFEELMLLVPTGKFEHRTSKRDIVEWYATSYMAYYFSLPKMLSTESMYRMMDCFDDHEQERIGDALAQRLIALGSTPSSIIFDTTNFATNIEQGEELPQKGKSKEGRHEQNLVGVALAVTKENIPFLWDTYAGNRNDARVFPDMVHAIVQRLRRLQVNTKDIILVFDRGNNSTENINRVLEDMHVIGGVKRSQAPALYDVPLDRMEFLYETSKKNKVLGYTTQQVLFDRKFTCVVTYNEASYRQQLHGFERQKQKILKQLSLIDKSLIRKGKGRKLTLAGAVRKAHDGIPKNLRSLVTIQTSDGTFCWRWNPGKEEKLRKAFGKQVLFTDLHTWSAQDITLAYNRKNIVESDFKIMRNALIFSIPPIGHRKDHRINAHVFLCLLGVVFYRYILWKTQHLGISEDDFLDALDTMQVSLVSGRSNHRAWWVVNQMNRVQASIFTALNMGRFLPKNR